MQVSAPLFTFVGNPYMRRLYVLSVWQSSDPKLRGWTKAFTNRKKIWRHLTEKTESVAVYFVRIDDANRIYPDKKLNKYRNYMNLFPKAIVGTTHTMYFNCLKDDNSVTTYKLVSYATED